MTQSHLTFDEAVASDQFKIMAKQRLKTTWTALYGVMEEAML